MDIVDKWEYKQLAMEEDPGDYRSDSKFAIIVDPAVSGGNYVQGLTVFKEKIAPGDQIPLHQHTIEEVLFVDEGEIEVRFGEERNVIQPGAIVFIPAKTPHGFKKVGETVALYSLQFYLGKHNFYG